VCVCVCIYIYIYIYMCVCMCVCMDIVRFKPVLCPVLGETLSVLLHNFSSYMRLEYRINLSAIFKYTTLITRECHKKLLTSYVVPD